MKSNHESIMNFIHKAIHCCKNDIVFDGIKQQLFGILKSVEKISKKRSIRESQIEIFAEKAKKNNEKWMQSLKNNQNIGDNND